MRALIADYAVILTIVTFVAFDHYYGLATPKLIVPTIFKVGDDMHIICYIYPQSIYIYGLKTLHVDIIHLVAAHPI